MKLKNLLHPIDWIEDDYAEVSCICLVSIILFCMASVFAVALKFSSLFYLFITASVVSFAILLFACVVYCAEENRKKKEELERRKKEQEKSRKS